MREKRVNLVVLTCSVVVATCASLSYCLVTADNHLSFVDKYVAVITRALPLLLSGQISTASAATVWIPSEEAIDTGGSVNDEFAEVAHVFARPEQKVVKPRDEDEILQNPIPWMSLKNEWKIYQKIQSSQRRKPSVKLGKKKGSEQAANDDDDDGSSEEDDGEEDDDGGSEEEDDDQQGRSGIKPPPSGGKPVKGPGSQERTGKPSSAPVPSAETPGPQPKKEGLPLAFYGQQNHDDDEHDYLKQEKQNFSKKQKKGDEEEDDDTSASNEAASVEDYADYALDDDDDDDAEDEEGEDNPHTKTNGGFENIPLAIREMILNDLANQNNETGYHPNLTPQVTGGSSSGETPSPTPNSASAENDDNSGEENSSEEDEEDDDTNAPEVVKLADSQPTPPVYRPTPKPKKGEDDEEDVQGEDEGGKGKGKGKGKKKGKKGKGKQKGWGKPKGWGWKPPPPPPKEHGWGWDPEKHDGVLEQLVRGSTWERVLKYYHWRRDQEVKGEKGHHAQDHHDHHHGGESHEQPGLEFAGLLHPPVGWGESEHQPDSGIKKIVKGAFKGSFWERAVNTYAKYKENQANKPPKKPTILDLDTASLGLGLGP